MEKLILFFEEKLKLILGMIFVFLLFACRLYAFTIIPPKPEPLSKENFTYSVDHQTTDLGNNFFGVIVLESNSEPKYSYQIPIYVVRINELLEGDVQWVFIKEIKFKNNKIITITNYKNDVFEFNINTYEVKCISKRSRVFDFDIDTFNLICDSSATDSTIKELFEIDLKNKIENNGKYTGPQKRVQKLSKIEDVIKVCENSLFDIYGIKTIRDEMPYKIFRYKNQWIVEGSSPDNYLGGVFQIILNAETSQIESIIHGE